MLVYYVSYINVYLSTHVHAYSYVLIIYTFIYIHYTYVPWPYVRGSGPGFCLRATGLGGPKTASVPPASGFPWALRSGLRAWVLWRVAGLGHEKLQVTFTEALRASLLAFGLVVVSWLCSCSGAYLSVLQPPRNKKFKLFHKEQIREPNKSKALPLVKKGKQAHVSYGQYHV